MPPYNNSIEELIKYFDPEQCYSVCETTEQLKNLEFTHDDQAQKSGDHPSIKARIKENCNYTKSSVADVMPSMTCHLPPALVGSKTIRTIQNIEAVSLNNISVR